MSLHLEFPDEYRLWYALVHTRPERIFVPAREYPRAGTVAPLRLSIRGGRVHCVVAATVVGYRRATERFPGGVFVQVEGREMEKLRRYLGLSRAREKIDEVRTAPRIPCELPLRLLEPALPEKGTVLNLSETGFLVKTNAPLLEGRPVTFEVGLGQAGTLSAEAVVSWSRPERELLGLWIISISPDNSRRLEAAIGALLAAKKAGSTDRPLILIADRSQPALDILSEGLAGKGYQVRTATRGDEAFALARILRPKLVIVDILMPGMDGLEVCKMMRADPELANIPLLVLSALDREMLHSVTDQAGGNDYAQKPIQLGELGQQVQALLRT